METVCLVCPILYRVMFSIYLLLCSIQFIVLDLSTAILVSLQSLHFFNGIHRLEIVTTSLSCSCQWCSHAKIIKSSSVLRVWQTFHVEKFVRVDLISHCIPVSPRSCKVQITSVLVEQFKVLNSLWIVVLQWVTLSLLIWYTTSRQLELMMLVYGSRSWLI